MSNGDRRVQNPSLLPTSSESWRAASGGIFSFPLSSPPTLSCHQYKNHSKYKGTILANMKYSVHNATVADIPALSTISLAAFKDDPCVGYLARNVPPGKMFAYQCQLFEWRFRTSSLNGLKVFKAVDEETGWVIQYNTPHHNTQLKNMTHELQERSEAIGSMTKCYIY